MSIDYTTQRINETKKTIDESPELKKLVEENTEYVTRIQKYSFDELISELQPKWSNQRFLEQREAEELTLLLLEYRLRGLDIEYFTQGGGSYIKTNKDSECSLL